MGQAQPTLLYCCTAVLLYCFGTLIVSWWQPAAEVGLDASARQLPPCVSRRKTCGSSNTGMLTRQPRMPWLDPDCSCWCSGLAPTASRRGGAAAASRAAPSRGLCRARLAGRQALQDLPEALLWGRKGLAR